MTEVGKGTRRIMDDRLRRRSYERWPISMSGSPAASSADTRGHAAPTISRSTAFRTFPHVTQMICGGGPCCSSNCTKSSSFVTTTAALPKRAASKIAASSACTRPTSKTWRASTPCSRASHRASAGGNCASIQIVRDGSLAASPAFTAYAATFGWSRRRAAYSRHAAISSASRYGKSARICSCDSPAASNSNTSITRTRIPRMQGRPPHCSRRTVIRWTKSACVTTSLVRVARRLAPNQSLVQRHLMAGQKDRLAGAA